MVRKVMAPDETLFRGEKAANFAGPARVTVTEPGERSKALPPRHDLRNHSPDGFQWGYGGSGPAQLALALLCYATDEGFAQEHYQAFKSDVVARLPDRWTLDAWTIRERAGYAPAGAA
jgi:hypothetical protein